MTRLFPRQRLRLALFICPTLRVFNGPEAARALDLPGDWLQFARKGCDTEAKVAFSKPFFDPEESREFRSDRRCRRIERAKEILEIHRRVQTHGLVGEGDLSGDALAERLAVLLFGEF